MNALALFVLVLVSSASYAKPFQWVSADRLSLELKEIAPGKRDPYFDQEEEHWQYKLNLLWDVRLMERLFLVSDSYFSTSNNKVTHIGWHYRSGIHVLDWLDIVHEHHSQHAADKSRPTKFPLEDSYGIRINFIGDSTK